jgi:peptidyl-dipeptidase Dcp
MSVSQNPLLKPWSGPYGGVPPWDEMRAAHFPEALEAGVNEQRAEVDAVANHADAPTFDNTILALERSGALLDRVQRLFGVARENVTTPEYQALEREWQPKLSAAADAIVFNRRLFDRIETVYRSLPGTDLDREQIRLVTRLRDSLLRRGAKLDDAGHARLSQINQELAGLFAVFRANVLADENTWTVIADATALAGLPDSVVSAASAAAHARGLSGQWLIVNTRSSVDPFLTFSTQRHLREVVWRRFKCRGDNNDANDTKAIICAIVKLRAERARLVGFASHAHWRMADSMAGDPQAADVFMRKVWPAAVAQVRNDVAEMQRFAQQEQPGTAIEPWDYLYFAEKVRKATYDLDQGEVKPYFTLDNMVAAMMWSAERRFHISFTEITGRVPVFDPEVRVWEVVDGPTGAHRGLFYLDNFARPGKRSGAWATSYRVQSSFDGWVTPIASNNNNFVKASPGGPELLSLDDAETLFHEFGHALHTLLQNIRYRSLATTPRDFVELPSQLNERWLLTREVLDGFARHYRSGAAMPQALVDKIVRSQKFNQGYRTVEYLSAAIIDMELHTRTASVDDMREFERHALNELQGMPREVAMRHRLPQFDHLFGSDSYSAGYYSYLWADVMAADAWQAFMEAEGPWDRAVTERLEKHILSDGNSSDRAEAYRRFRGRDPDPAALLEARGFSSVEQ